ncbi:MAG TPA: glycosyltransferase [Polyangiaceae bacterium]|nr:glycosyltransferase [Polyangiaceae bacterium]
MKIYLVEPEAQGRVSGGYLYNRRLTAAADAFGIVSVARAALATSLNDLAPAPSDWLLLDSLFLEPTAFARFAEVRRCTGCRLGLVLHAFPSFVERADRGDKAALIDPRPTESELALIEQLDVVVCPGPHGPRVLRESGSQTPAVTCPPGPTTTRISAIGSTRPAAPIRVLTVGNVTRGKGYQDAVEALAACMDLHWRWQIVGSLEWDPSWAAELERRVFSAGLAARTEFLGQLSPEATAQKYLESDVFLLPSLSENHPLVLMEARAYGVPVVSYHVGGVPDVVSGAGLLASPFDVAELAALLRRLLSDTGERMRLRGIALRADSGAPEWAESAKSLYRQLQVLDVRVRSQ